MAGIWALLGDRLRTWFRRTAPAEAPLMGAPTTQRQKTYSADSGYVYLYHFQGFREDHRSWEYVFIVSGDRRQWFPVSVFVERETLRAWSREHARELGASERFAVAKIALRRAFDARQTPADMRAPVRVDATEMLAIAEVLDLL
jgi:hypothetical protein